jgi:hypothetical protein
VAAVVRGLQREVVVQPLHQLVMLVVGEWRCLVLVGWLVLLAPLAWVLLAQA